MRKTLFIVPAIFFAVILFSAFSSAQCSVDTTAKNTQDFLKEIATLDSAFTTCPTAIPEAMKSLVDNENVMMVIDMQDGSTEQVLVEIQNGYIAGMKWNEGTGTGYTISVDECALDTALRNDNKMGVYAHLYAQSRIDISASGLWKSIKLAIGKLAAGGKIKGLATPVTIECSDKTVPLNAAFSNGKPDNCDETYLPGHSGYAENKALWDGYSLDADKVCQSQYGKGIPSPCVHTVQLSVSGNPYYLCWYNE